MAASWVVPWSSPGVSNWCPERPRGTGEAGVAGFARIARLRSKSLGYGVWSGREAERSTLLQMASAEVGGAATSSASSSLAPAERQEKEAAEMVQEFYAAINRREIASIGDLFADDCVYEDLVFPKPFLGRKVLCSS